MSSKSGQGESRSRCHQIVQQTQGSFEAPADRISDTNGLSQVDQVLLVEEDQAGHIEQHGLPPGAMKRGCAKWLPGELADVPPDLRTG
jgi:hypothetical protein